MNDTNIIIAALGGGRTTVTAKRYMTDYGQVLKITGVDLPEVYRVDFSNDEFKGDYVRMVGNEDGVLVPKQFFESGLDIWAFLVSVKESSERTVEKIRILNGKRPNNNVDPQPEPVEKDVIDTVIVEINKAADKMEAAVEKTEQDASKAEEARTGAEQARDRAEAARDQSVTAKDTAVDAAGDAWRYASAADLSAQAANLDKQDADRYARAAGISAERAEQAANTAGWVDFYIDADGYLHYVKAESVGLDFYVDADGYLHVVMED